MMQPRRLGWLGVFVIVGLPWFVTDRHAISTSTAETVDLPSTAPHPVRVTHELLEVPVVHETAPRTSTPRVAISPPVQRAATQPPAATRPGVTRRAMRALLGDGRYRPAPFPTVDKPPGP